jgi:hypothetical protein
LERTVTCLQTQDFRNQEGMVIIEGVGRGTGLRVGTRWRLRQSKSELGREGSEDLRAEDEKQSRKHRVWETSQVQGVITSCRCSSVRLLPLPTLSMCPHLGKPAL